MSSTRPDLSLASGVLTDMDHDGDTLLVAFGGIMNHIGGIPIFEFFSILSRVDLAAKRVFLRDLSQAWYQLGVDGAGSNVPAVAAWLRELVADAQAARVVMLGASSGGFAALLFGALTGAHEVHAFGPQTFIDRYHQLLHRDFRHSTRTRAIRALAGVDRRYLDVKPLVARAARRPHGPQRFVIHFAESNRFDVLHARRMRRIPTVELRPYPYSDHNVIGLLRDSGELPSLLSSIVSSEA